MNQVYGTGPLKLQGILIWMFPEIVGFLPNHPILIRFSIIFTIHFGGFPPIFGFTHPYGSTSLALAWAETSIGTAISEMDGNAYSGPPSCAEVDRRKSPFFFEVPKTNAYFVSTFFLGNPWGPFKKPSN